MERKLLHTSIIIYLLLFAVIPLFLSPSAAGHVGDISKTASLLAEKAAVQPPAKQTLIVGILRNGANSSLENTPWELTFKRLNQHPKYQFTASFLSREQLARTIDNDAVDFVISDAINYPQLEQHFGILRLLTRSVIYANTYFNFEALSIFISDRNTTITRVSDLTNKRVALLDNAGAVSEQFIEYFLRKHNLQAGRNIHLSHFQKLEEIIPLLHNKKLDALMIKSGYLEEHHENTLESSKTAYLENMHIVNPRKGWQAPFLHTSTLIPEWAFAKAWFIDEQLANQVVALLISKDDNLEYDTLLHYHDQYHWSSPQKYFDTSQLYEISDDSTQTGTDNKLSDPFQYIDHTGSEFFKHKEYWIAFLSFLSLTIIFVLYLKSSHDLNRRLQRSKASLEQEIQERQQAQELALTHQAELAHVARLSTMGEMASGLAHELNQPLSAIHTYVQGCIRRINMGTDDPKAILNALDLTAQQANRAGEIIRRLRSFVRKSETHKTYTDINHIINEVTHFLETQLNEKDVRLIEQLEDDLPPVLADIIQLEQVLINLIKNAIEAMADLAEPLLTISTKRMNSAHIKVCIIDSGHGISEDKLKRIFNPFFTTKESGMGMGLSISYSIIEAHDGKLYAENNPGKGARFCFTLPVKDELPVEYNRQNVPMSNQDE